MRLIPVQPVGYGFPGTIEETAMRLINVRRIARNRRIERWVVTGVFLIVMAFVLGLLP